MQSNVVHLLSRSPEPTKSPDVQVDIVVLADDKGFVAAVRESLEERAPVWRARSPEESVDLLLAGRCGVLLIDMDAVTTPTAPVIERIVDQFPDTVVVVAARREQEAALARLVAEGLIYRLIHKPFTVKRAGIFLRAAMRAHLQRRDDPTARPELPLTGKLRTRLAAHRRLAIGVCTAAVVCVAVAGFVLTHQTRPPLPSQGAALPSADPVLSQARAAFAAGRYEAPAGRNALELYAAVLRDRPDNVEARRGLEISTTLLVERAEDAIAAGNASEARRLASRVLEVSPRHADARALLTRSDSAPRLSTTAVTTAGGKPVSAVSQNTRTVPDTDRSARAGAASNASSAALPVGPPVASSTTSAAPTASKTATPSPARATSPHVYADPIAAVVVNEDELPTARARTKLPRSGRSYGAPISSGHPTAGYVRRAPAAAAASSSTPGSPMPAPVAQASAPRPLLLDGDLLRLAAVEPAYPPEAFRNRVEGWAEVEFTVDESGAPREIAVTGAEPAGVFDVAAADAVAGWRYRPRVVNGRPVPQRTSVTLRFSVAD